MTETKRILLVGGHGKVALLAAPLLVRAGHHVDAVIRNPEHSDEVAATGATPVVSDVEGMDEAAWDALVAGHDIVVWSAGAGGGSAQRTYAVDRDAAIRSIDSAARNGVEKYVMVSYYGAGPDHGFPSEDGFFAYAESKAAADQHLRESSLHWTILAPSRLTLDQPTGRIEVAPNVTSGKGEVSRADVAAVVERAVARDDLAGRMIEFNNGDTPIDEALQP